MPDKEKSGEILLSEEERYFEIRIFNLFLEGRLSLTELDRLIYKRETKKQGAA